MKSDVFNVYDTLLPSYTAATATAAFELFAICLLIDFDLLQRLEALVTYIDVSLCESLEGF